MSEVNGSPSLSELKVRQIVDSRNFMSDKQ